MSKFKYYQTILILFVLAIGCKAQESSTASNMPTTLFQDSISIEGNTRIFEYLAPQNLKESPSLVFVLHGSNGNIADTRMYTNYEFERLASERKNQIVVYPQGYDKHWNDCRMNASYKANQEDVNDTAFFADMIDYFHEKFQINSEAVFVTGISNGGHMCYKLAYEIPNKIRGIAPFVANIPEDVTNDCTPKNEAISVLIINGTNDPINPYDGGWVVIGNDSTRGAVLPTRKTVDYWKSLMPCTSEPEVVEYEDYATNDESTVIHYKFKCEKENIKVELLKVIGGGHTVPLKDTPPIPERFKKMVGGKNLDINAPEMVLDFFESLVKPTK